MKGGGLGVVLRMLVSPALHQMADPVTQQQTCLVLVRLARFLLLVAAHALLYMVVEAQQAGSTTKVSDATHNHAVVLQQAIQACIPCPGEVHIRQVATITVLLSPPLPPPSTYVFEAPFLRFWYVYSIFLTATSTSTL